jgi:hypothetical protein
MKLQFLPKQKVLIVDRGDFSKRIEVYYQSTILLTSNEFNNSVIPIHPFLANATSYSKTTRTFQRDTLILQFSDSEGELLYLSQNTISNFHIEFLQ